MRACSQKGRVMWSAGWTVLLAILAVAWTSHPVHGQSAQKPVCEAAEHDEFGFWVGEWEIRQRNLQADGSWKEFDARTSVRPVVGGCALLEQWEGTVQLPWEGMQEPARIEGLSVRSYNPESGEWEIYWMDSLNPIFGEPNTGRFEDGTGSFYREGATAQGAPMKVRIRFFDIEQDAFRWDLAVSTDEGASWTTIWEMDQIRIAG